MAKHQKRQLSTPWLIVALVITVLGGVIFIGAVSGWFSQSKVKIDSEYYADGAEFMDITAGEYEGLIQSKKSFIVFIDQSGCTTADTLREYVTRYMTDTGILIYRMMFEAIKDTSLYEKVKYYPSVALVSKGHIAAYLRADNDEDADIYNNYEVFKAWLDSRLLR